MVKDLKGEDISMGCSGSAEGPAEWKRESKRKGSQVRAWESSRWKPAIGRSTELGQGTTERSGRLLGSGQLQK